MGERKYPRKLKSHPISAMVKASPLQLELAILEVKWGEKEVTQ
jgi:hypothetical protein